VQLGVRTDSDDLEGEVLERQQPPQLTSTDLEAALEPFRGLIQQRPPAISAVHVNGQRAYKLARAGESVELQARPVSVHRLELLHWDPELGRLELEVACSAGTYIRSLARDLGEALGCGGCLAQLQRTEALGFSLEQSVSWEQLEAVPLPALVDPLEALSHLQRHQLTTEALAGWRCGRLQACEPAWPIDAPVVVVSPDGNLAGMARVQASGQLQPRLVLDAAG
jgi:tRNA pseudouridine55 synthase